MFETLSGTFNAILSVTYVTWVLHINAATLRGLTETVTSVFAQEGKHIKFNSSKFDDRSIITINGEPFEDYVKRESIHELAKNNVLTATRCFDQRV